MVSELELQDAILRHALELQRLSAHEEAEALAVLRELEQELRQLLATGELSEMRKRDVETLIKQAKEAIDGQYATLAAQIDTHGIILVVAERTVDIMQDMIPRATIPTAERLASLSKDVLIDGAPSSAWWQKQATDLGFQFAREVRQGILLEETQEQIVTRIVGRRGEPGILDIARRHARTLVHSSVMTAANRARLETYRKNSRFAQGIRWMSTLDSHTCFQCATLDGAAWDFDGQPLEGTKLDLQFPPAHFSCRCVISLIPKSLDKLLGVTGLDEQINTGPRASSDGPTSDRNFKEFLSRQSDDWIDEWMGTKRAEAYLRGEITLNDLVTKSGRPRTLEELRLR